MSQCHSTIKQVNLVSVIFFNELNGQRLTISCNTFSAADRNITEATIASHAFLQQL